MTVPMRRRSDCPISVALDLLGDRWTLVIVRDLMVGSTRFGQFLDSGEAIATNILADRLARLERGGIVTKQRDSEHGARYIYELTDKGLDLVPLLIEIARWSVKHNADVTMPPGLLGRIEQEPEAVVTELVDALKKARRARAKLVVNKSL